MAVDVDGRWVAGIGDPSVVGWITVAAYAVAAALAWRNIGAARRTAVPAGFWIALTALLVALGVNKQLDLQSWFSQTGRDIAQAQGWYGQRRGVQAVFIVLLCTGAVAGVAAARRQLSTMWREYRWAFLGVCVLVTFIVIRAASFHHIDEMLGFDLGATRLGRALEIVGVVLVAVACASWHAMHRARVRRFALQRHLRERR
jgi:hypothetical protein